MRSIAWAVLFAGCDGNGAADGEPTISTGDTGTIHDTGTTPGARSVQVALERIDAPGPDPIRVVVTVERDGVPDEPGAVDVTFAGTPVAATSAAAGTWEAEWTPAEERIEVPITVRVDGVAAPSRTALVIPEIDDCWGQPEAVPGVVNSPAYEDSSEVSPDGEWLVISNYSPIDLISCFSIAPYPGPDAPACNRVIGPYGAPDRPDFPGAERILSATDIDHRIPSLGLVGEDGAEFEVALPPVTAYGFRRQADGTFGEPFVIGLDASGYPNAPFGINFATPPDGGTAELVFAWDDPTSAQPEADLHRATIALGEPNVLATLEGDAGVWTLTPPIPALDLADPEGLQSNPFVAADGVFLDKHDPVATEADLWFLPGAWDGALGPPVEVAVSQVGRDEFQPFASEGRLYYVTGAFEALRSAERLGGSPDRDDAFGAERLELDLAGPIPSPGSVVSLGEPSIALRDGGRELYFVYGSVTADGLDSDVGRVVSRPGCD